VQEPAASLSSPKCGMPLAAALRAVAPRSRPEPLGGRCSRTIGTLAQGLAVELTPRVRVNAVAPTYLDAILNQRPIAVREKRQWKPAISYCRYADDFLAVVKGTKAHAEAYAKPAERPERKLSSR
jgi:hypothetical protein